MKIVIFGLAISSSWGNGHATVWRGLLRVLIERGHQVVFFERDVPYYASNRDLFELSGGELFLYPDWPSIASIAKAHVADADAALVTSYCPDGLAATDLILDAPSALKVYYDLDTGVTLERIRAGEPVPYIGPRGLQDFDLVLSYTGGLALNELKTRLGAKQVFPLYGSVDPKVHFPVPPDERYCADLSYLGTFAQDRQDALERLFIQPARYLPDQRFLIGGSLYPLSFPWTKNIFFVHHVAPSDHPSFYCSSRLTMNVTRAAMARMGYCPPARLFEAAACGVPLLSDWWDGLDSFFTPGSEIIVARSTEDAIAALEMSPEALRTMASRARARVMAEHSAANRARELEEILSDGKRGPRAFPDSSRESHSAYAELNPL